MEEIHREIQSEFEATSPVGQEEPPKDLMSFLHQLKRAKTEGERQAEEDHECVWKQRFNDLQNWLLESNVLSNFVSLSKNSSLTATAAKQELTKEHKKVQETTFEVNKLRAQLELAENRVQELQSLLSKQDASGNYKTLQAPTSNQNILNLSNYMQPLQNTMMSQTYLSVPQERKSHIVPSSTNAGPFFKHNPIAQQPNRNSFGVMSPLVAAAVSPQFNRIMRISDLSQLSAATPVHFINNQMRTPDTQDNSQFYYQSTGGDHDLMLMNTQRHQMNHQLMNIDDDELIEIRPDRQTTVIDDAFPNQINFLRELSKDSQSSFTDGNKSLENVRDVTASNSPKLNFKQINEGGVSFGKSLKEEQQHDEDLHGPQAENETGIMSFSQNTTVMIQRQRRPFEEIIQRRNLKELLMNNDCECEFSRMTVLELDSTEGGFKQVNEQDPLFSMQRDVFEELILRAEPQIHIVPNLRKASTRRSTVRAPNRQSKIAPCLERISQNEKEDTETPQDEEEVKTPSPKQAKVYKANSQFESDQSVTMYDARLSTLEQQQTAGRHFNDTAGGLMNPILEEIEEENLLSTGSNAALRKRHERQSSRQRSQQAYFDAVQEDLLRHNLQLDDDSEGEGLQTEEAVMKDNQLSLANQNSLASYKSATLAIQKKLGDEDSPDFLLANDDDTKPNASARKGQSKEKTIIVSRSQSYADSIEEVEESKINRGTTQSIVKLNYPQENDTATSSSSMVVFPTKNLQDSELRVNRTKTLYLRDSNLQDTSRNRLASVYNPEFSSSYKNEMNNSIVFYLRKSIAHRQQPPTPSSHLPPQPILNQLKSMTGDDLPDETVSHLDTYSSKIVNASKNRQFLSPKKVVSVGEHKKSESLTEEPIYSEEPDLSLLYKNKNFSHTVTQHPEVIIQKLDQSIPHTMVASEEKPNARSLNFTASFNNLKVLTTQFFSERRGVSNSLSSPLSHSLHDLMQQQQSSRSQRNLKLKSHRYFEEFLVIGVDSESLENVDGDLVREVPKNLYRFPPSDQHNNSTSGSERTQVVKDFCFPNGVCIERLNYQYDSEKNQAQGDQHVEELVQDILYGAKNWRENTFVFTLDANEEVGETGDNYMNCMCVIFTQLIRRHSDGQLFAVQQGYCFMFTNPYFPVHHEVLSGLLHSLKWERSSILCAELYESGPGQLNKEIEAFLKVPTIPQEFLHILSKYYEIQDNSEEFPYNEVIAIEFSKNQGEVKYSFPGDFDECSLMEHYWFCPPVFSLFYVDDFYKILTAVLLERSLIFVADELTLLSSVILGLKTLIKPFQWCYALIPVLPSPLIDILDTPQPILVGITSNDYSQLQLSEDEKATKTWVFLERSRIQIEWGIYDDDLSNKRTMEKLLRWCSSLQKDTQELFARFYDSNSYHQYGRFSGGGANAASAISSRVTEFRRSPDSMGGGGGGGEPGFSYVIVPSDQQKSACKQICQKIQKTISEKILKNIPGVPKLKPSKLAIKFEVDMGELSKEVLKKSAKKEEHEFLKKFVQTQMFVTLVEDYFNRNLRCNDQMLKQLTNLITEEKDP